jgi:hypothetical protein
MQRTDTRSRFTTSYARIALMIAVLAAMGVAAASASAYIYVSGPVTNWLYGPNPNPSTIERLTLDGSAVQPNFISPTRANWGIQVYGDRIYWLDYPGGHDCKLKSASLDGTDIETLAPVDVWGCSSASMAITNGYLYWGSASDRGAIGRVSLQPPYDVQPDFIRLPKFDPTSPYDERGYTTSLVTDGTWLYWSDDMRNTVGRARVDGTDVEPALFTGGQVGILFGVSEGYLYWGWNGGDGTVGRARVDGTDVQPAFLMGFHTFVGALTDHWLYFTGSQCVPEVGDAPNAPGCVNIDGAVRRVALEPGATPELVAQGLGEGAGMSIGVDSLGALFPKVRITTHSNGTATAAVSTPRPAKVSVRGDRIVPAEATRARNKVARIAIRPRHKTKRSLRRHGAAHVRFRLRYRPQGGLPRSQARTVTLHLARRG